MSSEIELPRIALSPRIRAKLEIRLAQNSDRPKTKVVPRARFASANSLLRTRLRGLRISLIIKQRSPCDSPSQQTTDFSLTRPRAAPDSRHWTTRSAHREHRTPRERLRLIASLLPDSHLSPLPWRRLCYRWGRINLLTRTYSTGVPRHRS